MVRHFAFVNLPASGHVNPTLALVAELVRRGHRVTYAVGPRLIPAVTKAGATPLVLPTEIRLAKLAGGFTLNGVESLLRFYVDDARQCLPQLVDHFRSDPPDAVCFDSMVVQGAMLADALDLPSIATFANFASHESLRLDQVVQTGPALPPRAIAEFAAGMGELAARYDISTPGVPLDGARPASLNLVFLPRRFQPAAETFDDRFRFIGPQIGDRDRDSWQPTNPAAPLLLISLGTAFTNRPDFYRMCLRAFGDTRWQVAMSVGTQVDAAALGRIPDNVEVRASFPQLAVLAHATAFLSHAGMNSTMESLHEGVPLIGVPQMPEQTANAARVDELGLGRCLDPATITEEQLRATVDVVTSDLTIRANLAAMRAEIRRCGGTNAGADAIEAQVPR